LNGRYTVAYRSLCVRIESPNLDHSTYVIREIDGQRPKLSVIDLPSIGYSIEAGLNRG
jgi:hypothetical protein